MGRIGRHQDLQELLGAYALDALDPDEAALVDTHLASCPRCRAELAAHRDVTGLFAYSGQEAPAGVWDRIVASMQEAPPPLRMDRIRSTAPDLRESPVTPARAEGVGPGAVVALNLGGSGRSEPRASRRSGRQPMSAAGRFRATLAVAAAAAIVVAALGVEVEHLRHQVNEIPAAAQPAAGPTATMADVRRALRSPGSRKVVLSTMGGGAASLDAVVLPTGVGYLYDAHLTPLTADRTYQLWGVVGTARISYGLLGTDPTGVIRFEAGTGAQALAVTDEVASGVPVSHQPLTVIGAVYPPL